MVGRRHELNPFKIYIQKPQNNWKAQSRNNKTNCIRKKYKTSRLNVPSSSVQFDHRRNYKENQTKTRERIMETEKQKIGSKASKIIAHYAEYFEKQ